MALFPAFIDLKNQEILIVGGGNIALHKIGKLLPFSPKITVVADRVNDEIKGLAAEGKLILVSRKYQEGDITPTQKLIIVAADDIELQKELYKLCQQQGRLYNCVDIPEYCNFIFPSLVMGENLTVGITTSGKAPSVSGRVRQIIEKALPEEIEQIIAEIDELRNSMPKGIKRQQLVIEKTNELLPIDSNQ